MKSYEDNVEIELSIIAPCLNEEKLVSEFLFRAKDSAEKVTDRWEIIMVDDGSSDSTWDAIREHHRKNGRIKGLRLSKNHGHQTALTAGLKASTGARVLVIDSDLQDPPELLVEMNRLMNESGADVVHAVRKTREGETWFKLLTAAGFYWFLGFLSDLRIPKNSGDFKLISRRVVDVINQMPEGHRYLRGMIYSVGFRQVTLEYERKPRAKGKSKFGLFRMVRFALDGITSFSMKPLRLATLVGFISGILGLFWAIWSVISSCLLGQPFSSISIFLPLFLFFSGLQLTVAGIMGEYVGRIFEQVKNRPLYIIDEQVGVCLDATEVLDS
ncbi:MAG: glycosyltransferase family 2 protein [Aliarcobacter sp.]